MQLHFLVPYSWGNRDVVSGNLEGWFVCKRKERNKTTTKKKLCISLSALKLWASQPRDHPTLKTWTCILWQEVHALCLCPRWNVSGCRAMLSWLCWRGWGCPSSCPLLVPCWRVAGRCCGWSGFLLWLLLLLKFGQITGKEPPGLWDAVWLGAAETCTSPGAHRSSRGHGLGAWSLPQSLVWTPSEPPSTNLRL